MMTVDDALNHAQNELESAFEKWLSDECPSGDCESVQRQWDESFVHQELVDELQPVMALTWEVRRLREENERLRENAKIIYELEQLAARSNNELLVENERLRKDAERLDWISRQSLDDLCMMLVMDADHDGDYYVEGDDNQKGYGLTLRDAIDAARGAK